MDYHLGFILLLNYICSIIFNHIILVFIFICVLIILFVFIYTKEILFSLTSLDFKYLKIKNKKGYKKLIYLLKKPNRFLMSYTIILVLGEIVFILFFNHILDDFLEDFFAHFFYFFWAFKIIFIAFFSFYLIHLFPKVLANQKQKKFLIYIIDIAFYFQRYFIVISKYIEKKMKKIQFIKDPSVLNNINNNLINKIVDTTFNNNAIEKKLLKNIVRFHNLTVSKIMKSKLDIIGIDIKTSPQKLIEIINEWNYSRLPVYNNSLNSIIGIIYTKDLIQYLHEFFNNTDSKFTWQSLIKPPYFVHEQKRVDELLQEFQQKFIHFACVVDEFGETAGIITLEDILEEIVGEIHDDFDEENNWYEKLDENTYIFSGHSLIYDVFKVLKISNEVLIEYDIESNTIAGLFLELFEIFPEIHDYCFFQDWKLTIKSIEKTKLTKIEITKKNEK